MTKLTKPDKLDLAMMETATVKKTTERPIFLKYLNAKTLDTANRIALIEKYNEHFTPPISLSTNCGGTLKAIQIKLKKHFHLIKK